MIGLNRTHDPQRRSWVESANVAGADFPMQNLPFGIFRGADGVARGGVAIGDQIVDLVRLRAAGLLKGKAAEAARAAAGPVLNPLLQLGNAHASSLRAALSDLLDAAHEDRSHRAELGTCLVPIRLATLQLPVHIGAFTDFLCSIDHTLRLRRGVLPPAFKHLPIAYNGRATSVVVSGTAVTRPQGQFRQGEAVTFGAEPSLDFELEVGAFVGTGNELGRPFTLADADGHTFGHCLVNDWSARGIQFFESEPLGPFLGKSFATSISPWIVTAEALLPFRVAALVRDVGDPQPAHLTSEVNSELGALDLALEAFVLTPRMRASGLEPAPVTQTSFRSMYWTFAQMLTHHASNGCNLQPGDLLASGTTSGASAASRACLAELSQLGTLPLELTNGEMRTWLEDGDEVILRAHAEHPDYVPIGFGECRGVVRSGA
jgi:fumarylacetoacetase